ncbi:MAG TPA: hypothetical protein VJT67_06340, partial [Longimicrobiaceae bacterium]|nr:hypothetical protein [Longimicrobiaceae bacterium]
MNGFRLPLVMAFLAFLAGTLTGLRIGLVPGTIGLAVLPLLAGVALHRRVAGAPLGWRREEGVLLA